MTAIATRLLGISARLLWAAGVLAAVAGTATLSRADAPTRVLIVTGEDYAGHRWQETTPLLKAAIESREEMKADVLDDLTRLAAADLSPYASVVLHFKNYDPKVPGRAGFENLKRFVEQGGGLVLVHFACGAFEEFKDEFEPLAGRVWFGARSPAGRHQHDPYGEFTVNITDADHPITRGMKSFTTIDELYTCLEGDAPVTVLAEATSKVDGKVYPMAFVLRYGKGCVFHCVLGHNAASFQSEGAAALLCRGTAWTAGVE
ncbi:MAG: ThuA domain-containing protein [Thermoguttaceae bacterium]|jgi:type 1 glutamine amidotransferase|nr:ThuA domain-containing protein [Thermoguttaceae bacterium]